VAAVRRKRFVRPPHGWGTEIQDVARAYADLAAAVRPKAFGPHVATGRQSLQSARPSRIFRLRKF